MPSTLITSWYKKSITDQLEYQYPIQSPFKGHLMIWISWGFEYLEYQCQLAWYSIPGNRYPPSMGYATNCTGCLFPFPHDAQRPTNLWSARHRSRSSRARRALDPPGTGPSLQRVRAAFRSKPFKNNGHWIGWRENLQQTIHFPSFSHQTWDFLQIFP